MRMMHLFSRDGHIDLIHIANDTALLHMAALNSLAGGFGVSIFVLSVLSISNGLSTWIFDGVTLEEKVRGRIGQ